MKLFNAFGGMSAGLVCLLSGHGAWAADAPLTAPGSLRAGEIVAAVTAVNVTQHELKNEKPEDAEPSDSDPASAKPPFKLPSRLELTAGTDGLIQLSDVSKQISLFGEARYRLTKMLQFGGTVAYRSQSGNQTSDTAFQFLLGPTLNFFVGETDLESAIFISPQLGLTTGQTKFGDVVVNSNTQLTMSLTTGKRFKLANGIAYAPSVGVVKERDFSPSFVVQPISLSVFF